MKIGFLRNLKKVWLCLSRRKYKVGSFPTPWLLGMEEERNPEKTEVIFFFSFGLFRATPVAYGGSQARGPIGAVVPGLHHSHSNSGFEPHLLPIPQLRAMLDP